jgi:DNA-binding beta-propeller fold protein YncE
VTTAQVVSLLKPGFEDLRWLDLAIEADGTILAAGYNYGVGTGVYRIDPITGLSTVLNNTYGWQMPTGIVVADSGDIYVADSGVCADGMCSGGEIVHVNPTTGAVTALSSGGFIGGEIDLTLVPEPGSTLGLLSGVALLVGLAAGRARRSQR